MDEPLGGVGAGRGERAAHEILLCGAPAPEHARYLGAAGGLAVLKALHRPTGTVEVATDESEGAAGARLRLTIPGDGREPGGTRFEGRDSRPTGRRRRQSVPHPSPSRRP
ncbi:hypothetical protein ACFV27_04215 [Streptomyces antimycoticus]|uniref:hypothetical protein n=1 Tax=Streptomyces antimycoticus TaxID=68175 RepID=UPI0036B4DD52